MGGEVKILLTLGALVSLGLVADVLGRKTPVPRVTLLLLMGFVIGPSVLDFLPDFQEQWFPILTKIALAMVGFLLGEKMTLASLRERGRTVLWMSVGEVLAAATVVLSVLFLIGVRIEIALLLAGIAPASAPAATADVVREVKAEGEFSRTLLGIVAIDDAWGLLSFSVLLALTQALSGQSGWSGAILYGGREVMGALLLGGFLGIPMAYLTGRIRPGEPTQAEALGLVLLCGSLAIWLGVSYILASMVLGAVVANLAVHHERPFNAIEGIEWPFMILFFILAGASLHVNALINAGFTGALYMGSRVIGLYVGARIAGGLSRAPSPVSRWMGLALMPQAGVALGLALIAADHFPDLKDLLLPVVIGSTVVFEMFGPVVIRRVLVLVGEGRERQGNGYVEETSLER